ncbi:hypothetical protein KDH_41970 [Dictyobacter sp. S3.2.2.5]|uniref:3-keto-disaccharide hydrolase domain-containing protein n=2 Tax=Dictyobacter halimunensis TaxID=3026934 RepID=A0ABQ6FUU8_9CHLR|nr:hypothetical protein KDH_41970 [Dictyobacter sp. S3.2.2.5]
MATQAFQDAQQSRGGTNTQESLTPVQSPRPDTTETLAQSVQAPSGKQANGHTSQLNNKPRFSKSAFSKRNDQRTGETGTPTTNLTDASSNTQADLKPSNNLNGATGALPPDPNATRNLGNTGILPGPTGTLGNTGTLMHPAGEYSGDTGMLKLNQAVKVVRIPVAGKPGEYKTGILPMLAQSNTSTLPPASPPQKQTWQQKIKQHSKLVALATLIVLVIFSSGIYLLTHTAGNTTASTKHDSNSTKQVSLNATATADVKATATFDQSLLISDSLSSNTRGWLTTQTREELTKKGIRIFFQDNAYHISSTATGGITYFADSLLVNETPPANFTFSVDAQQIKGDENSQYNFYGLLFSYVEINQQPISYAFRVINTKADRRYEFCTFDNRRKEHKWSEPIWKKATGKEFHGGKAKNNLEVQVKDHAFAFYVNGQKLGSVRDAKYGPGWIGMGVNGLPAGSEVAFTNLLLTKN